MSVIPDDHGRDGLPNRPPISRSIVAAKHLRRSPLDCRTRKSRRCPTSPCRSLMLWRRLRQLFACPSESSICLSLRICPSETPKVHGVRKDVFLSQFRHDVNFYLKTEFEIQDTVGHGKSAKCFCPPDWVVPNDDQLFERIVDRKGQCEHYARASGGLVGPDAHPYCKGNRK